jgi:hypothetical protein
MFQMITLLCTYSMVLGGCSCCAVSLDYECLYIYIYEYIWVFSNVFRCFPLFTIFIIFILSGILLYACPVLYM